MGDSVVIGHDNKLYKIAVADLAQYEVHDDEATNEYRTEAEQQSGDEVEGFAASNLWIIRR